jgi:hypothetical protein
MNRRVNILCCCANYVFVYMNMYVNILCYCADYVFMYMNRYVNTIMLLYRLCICVHEQIRKYNYVTVQIMYLCT